MTPNHFKAMLKGHVCQTASQVNTGVNVDALIKSSAKHFRESSKGFNMYEDGVLQKMAKDRDTRKRVYERKQNAARTADGTRGAERIPAQDGTTPRTGK